MDIYHRHSDVEPITAGASSAPVPFVESIPVATTDSTEYIPSFREAMWMNPKRVWFRSTRVGRPISELAEAAVTDLETGTIGAISATALIGSGVLLTQGLDRARIVIQKAPPEAIDRMTEMNFNVPSSFAAAAIVTGAFAVCNSITGEVLNRAVDRFPALKEKFIKQFPRITRAAQDAIPKDSEQPLEEDAGKLQKVLRAVAPVDREGAISRLKRGGMGILLGSTIFVGTAASKDVATKERSALNAKVTRDASTVLFTFVYGVAEGVRHAVLSGDEERAETIIHHAGSTRNWNITSAVVIGATIGLNALARKSAAKKLAEATPSFVPNEEEK